LVEVTEVTKVIGDEHQAMDFLGIATKHLFVRQK
jgi:hypothetical protein